MCLPPPTLSSPKRGTGVGGGVRRQLSTLYRHCDVIQYRCRSRLVYSIDADVFTRRKTQFIQHRKGTDMGKHVMNLAVTVAEHVCRVRSAREVLARMDFSELGNADRVRLDREVVHLIARNYSCLVHNSGKKFSHWTIASPGKDADEDTKRRFFAASKAVHDARRYYWPTTSKAIKATPVQRAAKALQNLLAKAETQTEARRAIKALMLLVTKS